MSSHPDLKGYYTKFGQLVDSIEKASFDILAKVENAALVGPRGLERVVSDFV